MRTNPEPNSLYMGFWISLSLISARHFSICLYGCVLLQCNHCIGSNIFLGTFGSDQDCSDPHLWTLSTFRTEGMSSECHVKTEDVNFSLISGSIFWSVKISKATCILDLPWQIRREKVCLWISNSSCMILTVYQFCFDPLTNEISKGAAQGRTTAVFVDLVAVVWAR
jgi:hypothetical protein